MDEKTVARFWAKVNRNGRTVRPELGPCWEWTAHRNEHGYGRFGIGSSRVESAHRVSMMISGIDPSGKFVCHHCDNPACVRPNHLFLGDQFDNMRDAIRKGRNATGARHGSKTHPGRVVRGERHPAAKLTDSQVMEIRKDYANGVASEEIAAKFGIHPVYVPKVASGAAWSHVGGPTTSIGCCGERSRSRLKNADVMLMRHLYRLGSRMTDIGNWFGVTPQSVELIVKHKTWRHLP